MSFRHIFSRRLVYSPVVDVSESTYPFPLFEDSAQKINHPELASHIGHEWFLSDYYYLVHRCNIDSRFVNSNTEKYIIKNVIEQSPEELKGKDLTKWRNERCKEIFVAKRMWRRFGYGITFPFIDTP